MTNTDMLERKIENSGLSVPELAEFLGISECDMRCKLAGKKEFLASEIWRIGELLDLDARDVRSIFFAELVERE